MSITLTRRNPIFLFHGHRNSAVQDAIHMNPTSDAQKQQLFFAPCKNSKSDEMLPAERYFDIENEEGNYLHS